jgi:hypothetical protein
LDGGGNPERQCRVAVFSDQGVPYRRAEKTETKCSSEEDACPLKRAESSPTRRGTPRIIPKILHMYSSISIQSGIFYFIDRRGVKILLTFVTPFF